MDDILIRLQLAIPKVESWIRELHASHAGQAQPADSLGFDRLAKAWPTKFLQEARAVSVDRTPFPPVSAYGLPEFETMAKGAWAGITFGHVYFIDKTEANEATHFHELCHVVQWKALGVSDFLVTYAMGILAHGYAASPFEVIAYELQEEFESGRTRSGLVEVLTGHAREAHAKAAAAFRTLPHKP